MNQFQNETLDMASLRRIDQINASIQQGYGQFWNNARNANASRSPTELDSISPESVPTPKNESSFPFTLDDDENYLEDEHLVLERFKSCVMDLLLNKNIILDEFMLVQILARNNIHILRLPSQLYMQRCRSQICRNKLCFDFHCERERILGILLFNRIKYITSKQKSDPTNKFDPRFNVLTKNNKPTDTNMPLNVMQGLLENDFKEDESLPDCSLPRISPYTDIIGDNDAVLLSSSTTTPSHAFCHVSPRYPATGLLNNLPGNTTTFNPLMSELIHTQSSVLKYKNNFFIGRQIQFNNNVLGEIEEIDRDQVTISYPLSIQKLHRYKMIIDIKILEMYNQ